MGGGGAAKKQRYKEHLGHAELAQGLKRGALLRVPIRVNAHDRSQAFATVPGLPSDLMIRVGGFLCLRTFLSSRWTGAWWLWLPCYPAPAVRAVRTLG